MNEIFDQLIIGAVVGGFIMIIGIIRILFKKNTKTHSKYKSSDSFVWSRAILALISILLISFLMLGVGIANGEYSLILVSLITLSLVFYWLREGYFKKDKVIESSNKEVKEETQVEIKEDKPTNIDALSDNLTKLNELKEKGILTEEEFNEQKKKLLKQ